MGHGAKPRLPGDASINRMSPAVVSECSLGLGISKFWLGHCIPPRRTKDGGGKGLPVFAGAQRKAEVTCGAGCRPALGIDRIGCASQATQRAAHRRTGTQGVAGLGLGRAREQLRVGQENIDRLETAACPRMALASLRPFAMGVNPSLAFRGRSSVRRPTGFPSCSGSRRPCRRFSPSPS